LSCIKLTYEEFDTWRTNRGYSMPTFWQPRDKLVALQQKRKTWQASPGCDLTASEKAVCRAINEICPNGILDHKAKARNEHILRQLNNANEHPVAPRTIQRTLRKIQFR
jgi:hypothetical protein